QLPEVHNGIFLAEYVVEPALRQAHVQRHLAAFKPLDGHARARLLALHAAAAGLAGAGTDTTADALARTAGGRIFPDFVELHLSILLFHLHQVADFGDHAAHGRRIFQFAHAVHLVEAQPDQRLALVRLAADGAADLLHLEGFLGHRALLLGVGGAAAVDATRHD